MTESPNSPPPPPVQPPQPPAAQGFSDIEKVVAAAAAYKAPFFSTLAASFLLDNETDPVRRRQLERFRRLSLVWFGVGLAFAIVMLVVFLSFASSHGFVGSGCRGGYDPYFPEGTVYQSDQNGEWTATYQCTQGGTTTVPIAAKDVPGASDLP